MAEGLDPNTRLDLSRSCVLILDDNERYLEMLFQILTGFGIKTIHSCQTAADARAAVAAHRVDLAIVDMMLGEEDGCDWVRWLRRSAIETNYHAPVLMMSAHSSAGRVAKARDSGANFMVAKPLVPAVLLERMLWVARSNRKFVESETYVGPDRRFRAAGPPEGVAGRRVEDQAVEDRAVKPDDTPGDQMSASASEPQRVEI